MLASQEKEVKVHAAVLPVISTVEEQQYVIAADTITNTIQLNL